MGQGTDIPPSTIIINNYTMEAVSNYLFNYLGSTITKDLSLEPETSSRIRKAASSFWKITSRVWDNRKLPPEAWTPYSHQERRLNSIHLHCLRRILGISWQDRVTKTRVLERSQLPSIFSLLRQPRLHWLGHVRRLDDGRIPKDILYAELYSGKANWPAPTSL